MKSPRFEKQNSFEDINPDVVERKGMLIQREQSDIETSGVLQKFSPRVQKILMGGLVMLSLTGAVACTKEDDKPKKFLTYEEQMGEMRKGMDDTIKMFKIINEHGIPAVGSEKPVLSEKEKLEKQKRDQEEITKAVDKFWKK